MRTIVYIDGFNLYFGALKGTPHKWLDVRRMAELLLPKSEIASVRYFTARISGRANDPDAPRRQDAYLRALETLPGVTIHLGHFLSHTVRMPLVSCRHSCDQRSVEVLKTEEKGSDVNLASYMLRDAFKDAFEVAAVVSNDSDLATPVVMVRREFGKRVGILNPHGHPSRQLEKSADFMKQIRSGLLRECQLPPVISTSRAPIRKPKAW